MGEREAYKFLNTQYFKIVKDSSLLLGGRELLFDDHGAIYFLKQIVV